jgi:hypothetical protein
LVYDFISRAQVTQQKACHVHCDVNLSHMLAILVMYKISVITSRMQEDGFNIPPWTAKNLDRKERSPFNVEEHYACSHLH